MTGVPALASIKNRLYGSCSHFGGWHAAKCCLLVAWQSHNTYRRTALQTASVITDGYYLDGFFKTFINRGKVCWACTSFLQQCPALHSDDNTWIDLRAAQCNWPFCVGHWASAGTITVTVKPPSDVSEWTFLVILWLDSAIVSPLSFKLP